MEFLVLMIGIYLSLSWLAMVDFSLYAEAIIKYGPLDWHFPFAGIYVWWNLRRKDETGRKYWLLTHNKAYADRMGYHK